MSLKLTDKGTKELSPATALSALPEFKSTNEIKDLMRCEVSADEKFSEPVMISIINHISFKKQIDFGTAQYLCLKLLRETSGTDSDMGTSHIFLTPDKDDVTGAEQIGNFDPGRIKKVVTSSSSSSGGIMSYVARGSQDTVKEPSVKNALFHGEIQLAVESVLGKNSLRGFAKKLSIKFTEIISEDAKKLAADPSMTTWDSKLAFASKTCGSKSKGQGFSNREKYFITDVFDDSVIPDDIREAVTEENDRLAASKVKAADKSKRKR